jgi:2-aminoadipate transaminase
VIHIGSFSKSIAPALRVGFIVAPWDVMSRMLALKTDAGTAPRTAPDRAGRTARR